MKIEPSRADIVILAHSHNVGIVTEKWLKDKNLINEKPKQTIFMQGISLFESESFLIMVNPNKAQITAKRQSTEALETLTRIGNEYIKSSPYITYTALGLNFIWTTRTTEDEKFSEINIHMGAIPDLSSVLNGHRLTYGGIIHAKKDPYLLKLIIEPPKETERVYNFNYHHEIKDLDIEKIGNYIDNFLNLYKTSEKIVGILSKGAL